MMIKLDISKAYDRLKWCFLETMMKKLRFIEVWISQVMTYVTTMAYAVLVHGIPESNIVPSRGLRQGDPLSSYLYLICAEGLSCLLNEVEMSSKIKGV